MCIPTHKGALKKPRDMEKDWLELINGGPKKTLWLRVMIKMKDDDDYDFNRVTPSPKQTDRICF